MNERNNYNKLVINHKELTCTLQPIVLIIQESERELHLQHS